MGGIRDPADCGPLLTRSERILSQAFHGEVHLGDVERLTKEQSRNLLLRCAVASGPDGVAPVCIIKQAKEV